MTKKQSLKRARALLKTLVWKTSTCVETEQVQVGRFKRRPRRRPGQNLRRRNWKPIRWRTAKVRYTHKNAKLPGGGRVNLFYRGRKLTEAKLYLASTDSYINAVIIDDSKALLVERMAYLIREATSRLHYSIKGYAAKLAKLEADHLQQQAELCLLQSGKEPKR